SCHPHRVRIIKWQRGNGPARRNGRSEYQMIPGQVTSDRQAFDQIIGRLKSEVGAFIKLVSVGKKQGMFKDTAPFWSLARMMFPIAEAVGDLTHQNSPVKNL